MIKRSYKLRQTGRARVLATVLLFPKTFLYRPLAKKNGCVEIYIVYHRSHAIQISGITDVLNDLDGALGVVYWEPGWIGNDGKNFLDTENLFFSCLV